MPVPEENDLILILTDNILVHLKMSIMVSVSIVENLHE